jgi:hypothetical protein
MALNPSDQEWIRRRVSAVRKVYCVFDCLNENGHGDQLVDRETTLQIPCFLHEDNKPSARYYASDNDNSGRYYCFSCKTSADSINLFARIKNVKFIDALTELERRFKIKVLKKPETETFVEPTERDSSYRSDQWSDVPRMMTMLENKLTRLRGTVPLDNFIKYCRVLDKVQWDLEKSLGKQTNDMVAILQKLEAKMNNDLDLYLDLNLE